MPNSRLKRFFPLLLLFVASPAWGAIAFDSAASGSAGTNTVSWTHTATAGLSNSIAFCGVSTRGATAGTLSCSFGGTSMTKIREDGPNDLIISTIFVLLSQPSGAQTVTANSTGAVAIVGGSVVLSGVNQSTTPDAQNGNNGASGNPTVSVTTVADNAWVLDTVGVRAQGADPGLAMVAHTNRTQRWNLLSGTSGVAGGGSTLGPVSPPAATTMDWTQTGTRGWSISAASFAPAAAAKKRLPLLGVGD